MRPLSSSAHTFTSQLRNLSIPSVQATALDFSDFADNLTLDVDTTLDFGSYDFSTLGSGGLDFRRTGGTRFKSSVQIGEELSLEHISYPSGAPTNTPIRDITHSPDERCKVLVHDQEGK